MAIYGVRFDGTNSAGVRTDDAVGMVWERSTNEVAGQDDFASVSPFNVRECVTKYNSSLGKREVLGYKGDEGYDTLRADTTNDIMIEFPCFWYQRPSKYVWRISDSPVDGFKPAPMFYRNGKLYKTIRVSKYAVDNKYISQVGTYPLVSTNMNTFRTNLRAKGQYMIDYPAWCSITMLSLIKYANMNVQKTVGQGASTGDSIITSGDADSVLGLDGAAGDVSTTRLSVVTNGIENFYSNVWKYIDGLFAYQGHLYYKDLESMISDPVDVAELQSTYTQIATTYPIDANQSDIGDIAFDSAYDFGMFPTSKSTSNPSGDGWWSNGNFNCVRVGGSAWSSWVNGLFAFSITSSVGSLDSDYGATAIEFGEVIPQKQLYIASDNKVYAMMETV